MAEVQKQLEIKQSVERNCEELKLKMKEVWDFQRDMKHKEKTMKNEGASDKKVSTVPVRSQMQRDAEENPKRETDPHTEANTMKEKGNNCVKMKDFEGAIFHYTSAIETFPDDAIYYTNRALCNLKLDRQNKAIEDCNIAISLDRKCVKAFYRRMQANESLGNTEAALRDCEVVIQLEPSTISHRRDLERLKNCVKNEKNHTSNDEINNNRKRQGESWCGVPGKPWSRLDRDAREVDFVDKKPHLRSKKPMKRIEIVENHTKPEPIPDHIVDKLFNNFTGEYNVESSSPPSSSSAFNYSPAKPLTFFPRPSTSLQQETPSPKDEYDVFDDIKKYYEEPSKGTDKEPDTPKIEETPPMLPPKVKKTKQTDSTEENGDEKQEEVKKEISIPDVPSTNVQFCSTWKDLPDRTRAQYLEAIIAANNGVVKTLDALLDSSLLSQILATLANHFISKNLPVHITLNALATNTETRILSYFLTTKDRKSLDDLMDYMKNSNVNDIVISSISKAFNLKILSEISSAE
ncbi:hypothetical protein DMENIID0001_044710 [Sergentomyia squamirostris]